jgi:Protein of unknown function (DUF2752)
MKQLSRRGRFYRYGAIGVCSFPLVTSFRIAGGSPLGTFSCPIRYWCGAICPSCGLTRSFVALARGNLGQSIDYHAFGPLLFAGLTIALVHCLWELRCDRHLNFFYVRWLTKFPIQISIIVSFLGYYLLRLGQIIPTVHL